MGDNDTERARWLDDKDVIRLLKAAVERTGANQHSHNLPASIEITSIKFFAGKSR